MNVCRLRSSGARTRDVVGLLVEGQEQDREHRIDREHREERSARRRSCSGRGARSRRCATRNGRSRARRRDDRLSARRRSTAAKPTRPRSKALWNISHDGTSVVAARAARGGVVDDVEVAQRGDGRQRRCNDELVAHAGQRDGEELSDEARAVDARGLVELGGDSLSAGEEEHDAEPERDPRADKPDGRERPVKSPSHVFAMNRARPAQELVERARGVVDPRERLRDDDCRDRLRHEQNGAEERGSRARGSASSAPSASRPMTIEKTA